MTEQYARSSTAPATSRNVLLFENTGFTGPVGKVDFPLVARPRRRGVRPPPTTTKLPGGATMWDDVQAGQYDGDVGLHVLDCRVDINWSVTADTVFNDSGFTWCRCEPLWPSGKRVGW